MMDVEVDQSGRTDVLTVDTALALSDGLRRGILIPKKVKILSDEFGATSNSKPGTERGL